MKKKYNLTKAQLGVLYTFDESGNVVLTNNNYIWGHLKNRNSHILSVVSIATAKQQAETLFKSLNIIVYVLVLFSGALSFVVFYSLAYINISERQREIATLKVLGFYNKEIDNYILKEEFIITILGILVSIGVHFALKKINLIESLKSVE